MLKQISFADVLLDSAKEVFETMIFMSLEKSPEAAVVIDGSALIGTITFKGNMEGCFAIECGMDCAKTISMNMLGMDSEDEVGEDEVCDAIGEVANMVLGSIKTRIQDEVGDIQVSIPSVISGYELRNSLGEDAVKLILNLSLEGQYNVQMSLLYRASKG